MLTRARASVREALVNVITTLLGATSTCGFVKHFTMPCLFPAAILGVVEISDNGPKKHSSNIVTIVNMRLEQWVAGKYSELWRCAIRQSIAHINSQASPKQQRKYNYERATHFAKEGAYSKAVHALFSSGVHTHTPDIERTLLAKHPQSPPSSDATNLTDKNKPPDIAHTLFTAT